jgi:hypothetical protein
MSLEKTIKDLEALEESLKNNAEKLTDAQLEQIVNQLNASFDLAHNELDKLETESKITLENLQNEE